MSGADAATGAVWVPSSVPTLGVSGVLAGLWLLAASVGGADAELARALDPAAPTSVPDGWAIVLLGTAALAALSARDTRLLAVTPAVLLLAEAGELPARAAHVLAAAVPLLGSLPVAKLVALSLLGLLAGAPLLRARHRSCLSRRGGRAGAMLVAVAAVLAAGLDLAPVAPSAAVGDILATVEEWLELLAYSMIASWLLARRAEVVAPWYYCTEARR